MTNLVLRKPLWTFDGCWIRPDTPNHDALNTTTHDIRNEQNPYTVFSRKRNNNEKKNWWNSTLKFKLISKQNKLHENKKLYNFNKKIHKKNLKTRNIKANNNNDTHDRLPTPLKATETTWKFGSAGPYNKIILIDADKQNLKPLDSWENNQR